MTITEQLADACRAALAYDDAIRRCANDPSKMATFCTAQGDTLDDLYLEWMTKARRALGRYERTEAQE